MHHGFFLTLAAFGCSADLAFAEPWGAMGGPGDGLPSEYHDTIRAGSWSKAASVLDEQIGEAQDERSALRFGQAWLLWQAGETEGAAEALQRADVTGVPEGYVRFLRAAVEGTTTPNEAMIFLSEDPLVGPLADMELCLAADGADDAAMRQRFCRSAYERAPSINKDAARILAGASGQVGADEWNTGEISTNEATKLLASWVERGGGWSKMPDAMRVQRLSLLVKEGNYAAAVLHHTTAGPWDGLPQGLSCQRSHAIGKALYRTGRWSDGAPHLANAGKVCEGIDEGLGAASYYLLGTLRARKGQHTLASQAYDALAERYPDHSMADDAFTRGGVSLFETGAEKEAAERWTKALERYPGGDTTPESARRLALWHYDNKDPDAAAAVAARVSNMTSKQSDDVRAWGAYWHARWSLYPSVEDPEARNPDDVVWARGIQDMTDACQTFPSSLYGALAYARLLDAAPDSAITCLATIERQVGKTRPGTESAPPSPIASVDGLTAVAAIEGLAAAGLLHEGRALKQRSAALSDTVDTSIWWIRLVARSGDIVQAHREARRLLKSHPIGTLGHHEHAAVETAYPDWYFDAISSAAENYDYDARLLHALAREESAFNVSVRSHAGAIGLTQVMPKTAEQTAGWLGIRYDESKLRDPEYNATIGAKYLAHVYDGNGGNVALALAAYNAGPHRVDLWFKRFGNIPTDEFIERIPFKETRGYVRRVMGTWQILRWRSETAPVYPDASAFNHDIRPSS